MFSKLKKNFCNFVSIIKNEKKFISCEWLENGIIFDHANIIRVCCEQSHEGKGRYILEDSFNGLWLDIDKILNNKQVLKNKIRNNIIPDSCKGCQFLKNDFWKEKKVFSNILLTHWSNCNTRCIYCPAVRDNNLKDANHYNIIPIIEQLIDAKLVNQDTKFSIAGGESTIYPEFDKLLYFLIDYGIKNININSSGIKYSPSIADAISKNLAEIVISIDAASSFLYKLIKGTDTFNIVIENVKRYLDYQQIGEKRVILKFILLKGYNDNKKDLLDWFMLCSNIGIKKLALDIDIAWYNEMQANIPSYVIDLVLFAKEMSKLNNIELDLYDRACIIYKYSKIDRKEHK